MSAVSIESTSLVERVGDARLPTDVADFRIVAFRAHDGHEHVAIVAGVIDSAEPAIGRAEPAIGRAEPAIGRAEPAIGRAEPAIGRAEPVLTRLHSECLTGDVLGSSKCDCGQQLDAARRAIAAEAEAGRAGVVVYLRGHEGRGIGLANKIRAYELQDSGLDTVDANIAQGLPVDARQYDVAAAILLDLGVSHVRLISNNPAKAAGLVAHGIAVAEMVPIDVAHTQESRAYLASKRERLGHI